MSTQPLPPARGPAPHLALCGATVVTSLDPVSLVTADVVIAGDRIAAVGTAPAGVARRDCSGTLVLPGNVCAHHHLYSALSRGMPCRLAPPRNFLQILQRVWWRLDRALDEPSRSGRRPWSAGSTRSCAGTTTIIDHHASPNFIDGSLDVIADALAELGLRGVLCYEVTDRDGPARAAAGVAENRRFLAQPAAARARHGGRPRVVHALATRRWPLAPRPPRPPGSACTSTSPRTGPTSATREAATACASSSGWARRGS